MLRRQDDDVSWRPHDTDRSIDPYDDASRSPSSRRPVPPPPSRPGSRLKPSRVPRGVAPRSTLLAVGGVLAVVATLLVFLTEDPDLLRVAVVTAAWAFVLATFVAGRRGNDEGQAAEREAALRRTYEHELELEVAARREYELELENELRREAEDTMRGELDALRHELAGVAELRAEVARVAELRAEVARVADLRDDVAALSGLREEVARVAALREDVLSLAGLRTELGQLGELRAELGRLRSDLTEQLSSEMLVERIVMRTQASRLTADGGARLDAPGAWQDEAPRELTGGWPAVRLDEHTETQQYERVRVDRTSPPQPWQEVARAAPAVPVYTPPPVPAAAVPPAPPTEVYGMSLPPRRSRHAADGDEAAPRTAEQPAASLQRRRTDDGSPQADVAPDDVLTTERPAPPPPTGGRRRRRYRDDDGPEDDVLARVLRGGGR